MKYVVGEWLKLYVEGLEMRVKESNWTKNVVFMSRKFVRNNVG